MALGSDDREIRHLAVTRLEALGQIAQEAIPFLIKTLAEPMEVEVTSRGNEPDNPRLREPSLAAAAAARQDRTPHRSCRPGRRGPGRGHSIWRSRLSCHVNRSPNPFRAGGRGRHPYADRGRCKQASPPRQTDESSDPKSGSRSQLAPGRLNRSFERCVRSPQARPRPTRLSTYWHRVSNRNLQVLVSRPPWRSRLSDRRPRGSSRGSAPCRTIQTPA